MTVKVFTVGGCIRDELLGLPFKDVDFAIEATGGFEEMEAWIESEGFKVFKRKPEFLTIRAGVPKGHKLRVLTKDADFVLCRKDGPSSNGRHPDSVESGTILEDLARRDFTVNAMAKDSEGNLIDPFGGQRHCAASVLSFVGDPVQRIAEDGLRILRGFRFMVTKGFIPDVATANALFSASHEVLEGVSAERIQGELERMFKHDTIATIHILGELHIDMQRAIFKGGLRLAATLKE